MISIRYFPAAVNQISSFSRRCPIPEHIPQKNRIFERFFRIFLSFNDHNIFYLSLNKLILYIITIILYIILSQLFEICEGRLT